MNILNGVTVSVGTGEIVTVAGTNGAGKSTLAKAVVGLLPRVEGEIRFEGSVINAVPTEMRANRGIGYVPQVANIFLPSRCRKISRSWSGHGPAAAHGRAFRGVPGPCCTAAHARRFDVGR